MLRPLLGREGLRITCVTISKCPYLSVASSPDACCFKPKVKSCMSAKLNNFIGSMAFTLGNSLRKQPAFRDATTGFPAKWRLRNERRNSIRCVTTQVWVVLPIGWRKFLSWHNQSEALHRSGQWRIISMEFLRTVVFQTWFRGKTIGGVVKCRLFSQASCRETLSTFQNNWWNN